MSKHHELVLPNKDLPFKMFLFEGKEGNYRREKHWHSSVEVFAVFEGELEFFIEDRKTLLGPGKCMIVNSNELHAIYAPLPNDTIVIQIPLHFFEPYFTEEQLICFSHGEDGKDAEMMELIREMYLLYRQKETGHELQVISRFYSLAYRMVTKYRIVQVSEDVVRSRKNLRKLSIITKYIKEHYAEPVSLELLAETFGYSPAYLSRMFQKYAGINYKSYLQSIRLEHARRDMDNPELELGEIAQRHGFPDGRAFAKAFKKEYGVLPSIYKKTKKCS